MEKPFDKDRSNVHSQNGEDGIIAELLRRLPDVPRVCLEVGAHDGPTNSNTWYLLEQGWTGIYIESSKERYEQLRQNAEPHGDRAICIHEAIEPTGEHSIPAILARAYNDSRLASPREIGVMSIDIDAYDWEVVANLADQAEEYHPGHVIAGLPGVPHILITEVNSLIPPGILYYGPERLYGGCGCSYSAMVQALDRYCEHTVVAHTGNVISVRTHDYQYSWGYRWHPEALFDWRWIRAREERSVHRGRGCRRGA